ncbi:MAG TPA: transcription elongation factor GreB [Kofleriaceae bacterium]|nr:transcription elongation factor GreB [Kofleriaceae bacterium]
MRQRRPPSGSRSRYITRDGFERLKAELDHLWRIERPKVTREVADAAALGDRSENAEYIYGKKRLREIDRRLRFLGKRLKELRIVDDTGGESSVVRFGSWVTVEDDDGKRASYRVVGSDELDAKRGYISVDSPVAKALLGKREDDEVTVRRPKGEIAYTIIAIHTRAPAADP